MNFESIFKFKGEETETRKENITLNLPLWAKDDAPEIKTTEIKLPEKAEKKEDLPMPKIMDIKPISSTSTVFEKIDTTRFKGIPKFKPFNERISYQMNDKIVKNPSFPQVAKAFADKLAEKITDNSDLKDTISWLFQTIRIFNPTKPTDVIMREAKQAEELNEKYRAKLRYLDLAMFALVEGDANQLSTLTQKLHELAKEESEKNLPNQLDELFVKRFSIIANQPREIINTVNEFYPKFEEELVRYIEHAK